MCQNVHGRILNYALFWQAGVYNEIVSVRAWKQNSQQATASYNAWVSSNKHEQTVQLNFENEKSELRKEFDGVCVCVLAIEVVAYLRFGMYTQIG